MGETFGAFEAKNRLSELLERVAHGEEIVITKRGHPIARLVPIEGGRDTRRARAAVAGLRSLAREIGLTRFEWDEWKRLRDEGRR